MEYKVAELSDIESTLKLHYKYQVDSIDKKDKKDGFITTPFTKKQLANLINNEKGLFVAKKDGCVIAYAMSASWKFWSIWPMFTYMIEELPKLNYLGQTLSIKNSYQYGPICVDKKVRGSGVFEKTFNLARKEMMKRYPILVTFINKNNPRSYEAHTRKLGLEVIHEFKFNNNYYYELVYDTSKEV